MKLALLSNFQLKMLINRLPQPVLLSLDIGSQSTGIAHSSLDLKQAYFLRTIRSTNTVTDSNFYNTVKQIVQQHKVAALVLGTTPYLSSEARKDQVIAKLANFIDIPYTEVSQEATTIEATDYLFTFQKQMGTMGHLHRQKELKDGVAAMILLQRFLNYYNKK